MYNLAMAKDTVQSSDSDTSDRAHSYRAVDGTMGVTLSEGHCVVTGTDDSPWWEVVFGEVVHVSQVHILRMPGQNCESFRKIETKKNTYKIRCQDNICPLGIQVSNLLFWKVEN